MFFKPDDLALVELMMGVEETFGLTISDCDAESIETPGDLERCLIARLPPAAASPCLTARAFYRIRRAIAETLPPTPERIRPQTPWRDVLPAGARSASWRAIERAAGIPLGPGPYARCWWADSPLVATIVLGLSIPLWACVAAPRCPIPAFLAIASCVWLLVAGAAWRLERHKRTKDCVGATADLLALDSAHRLKDPGEGWSPGEVSRLVDRLVARSLGYRSIPDHIRFRDLVSG